MARLKTTLIVAAMLVATAGCAKKHPEQLPPAPGPGPGADTGNRDNIVPGSRADFERSVTSNTVHFALDKYDIDAEARAILDSQAAWLAKYPNVPVSLEGHCDERGTREYNLGLGDRRANAAKNYLAARGVAPGRISTISYGKERPIALGSDEASWAQNRRAVTIVLN
jgi:peptidoglycan-associated lipoprotein